MEKKRFLVLWVNGGGIQNVGIFEGDGHPEARGSAQKEWGISEDAVALAQIKTRIVDDLESGWSWLS